MENPSSLVLCPSCARHVRRAEHVCPFCGATRSTPVAGLRAGGLVVGAVLLAVAEGCGSPPAPVYGPPPQTPEAPAEQPAEQPADPEAPPDAPPAEPEVPIGGVTGMYGPPPGP